MRREEWEIIIGLLLGSVEVRLGLLHLIVIVGHHTLVVVMVILEPLEVLLVVARRKSHRIACALCVFFLRVIEWRLELGWPRGLNRGLEINAIRCAKLIEIEGL